MAGESLEELRRACTEKQARFAEEYVRLGGASAAKAAHEAGARGNAATCAVTASRWLKMAKVRAYIDALTARARPNVKRDVDAVLDRLSMIGMGEPIYPFRTKGGDKITVPAMPRDQVEALKTLAKIYGLLDPRVKVELETTIAGQLEKLRQHMPADAFRALLEALRQLGNQGASA